MGLRDVGSRLARAIAAAARPASRTRHPPATSTSRQPSSEEASKVASGAASGLGTLSASAPATDYRVDLHGLPEITYEPRRDGDADPGEVVWAWVPYEDDPRRGKDRPVLVVGRSNGRLIGLMLSSQDHDRDAADEARYGRFWMDVGAGAWDRQRRPSEVRLDRLLSLPVHGVRREGAALAPGIYGAVVARLHDLHSD